jgi:Taurine catabolism dioxygenase TauD, TfdA family
VKSRFAAILEPPRDRDYVLMTTNTEQQQAIWYVSGLAEVLARPGSQEQAEDAIVQFDRYRRTRTPGPLNASPNTLSHTARRRLDQWGYVVVDDVESLTAAEELVRSVGELIPQYNGRLTHEVTYRPGNDDGSYSQNTNTIFAHTEAPGWHPSPAYLALFCHRQARRGGGHTDLLDVRRLVGALDADELALMTDAELHFPGPDGGVHTTMLSTDAGGDTVTRFSYNLLTTADDDPTLGADVDPSRLPLGEAGRRLAHRISDLFGELCTSVLIPDGSLLIWDNQRMLHARSEYHNRSRRLTGFWSTDWRRA